MNRSDYLRALGVEEWRSRKSISYRGSGLGSTLGQAEKNIPIVERKNVLMISFEEFRIIVEDREILSSLTNFWTDIARSVGCEPKTGKFSRFLFPSTADALMDGYSESDFSELRDFMSNGITKILLFGVIWKQFFPELKEMENLEEKTIEGVEVLLVRSLEEFLYSPQQKMGAMDILLRWGSP
ncbi:MAG: hypothetical protein CMQ40_08390 [Gammaproteobacteria bacterium]|nr:hypothetical protein [Gammaproteobacteria bacterium]